LVVADYSVQANNSKDLNVGAVALARCWEHLEYTLPTSIFIISTSSSYIA